MLWTIENILKCEILYFFIFPVKLVLSAGELKFSVFVCNTTNDK